MPDDNDAPAHRYDARLANEIEAKWQDRWETEHTFWAPNPDGALREGFDAVADRSKLFVLDMFPYPSGKGIHVGHPLGYIGTDVYARFKRMTGHNVLHAMGYDAFGLPAEQFAVQTGQHPRVATEANIDNMRRQLRALGVGGPEGVLGLPPVLPLRLDLVREAGVVPVRGGVGRVSHRRASVGDVARPTRGVVARLPARRSCPTSRVRSEHVFGVSRTSGRSTLG
jgi:hypothetical protein